VLRLTVAAAGDRPTMWQLSPNGGNFQPLFADPNAPGDGGEWTRNGKYFLFDRTFGNDRDIWVWPEGVPRPPWNQARPWPLTAGPIHFFSPVAGPDGKVFALGMHPRGELMRYDKKSRLFTPYWPGISAKGLAFSSDGQWVAYTAFPEGTLWRAHLDGSDRLQLTAPGLQTIMARWSPDGKSIFFSAQSAVGGDSRIYRIAAAGGPLERISEAGGGPQGSPSLSPDGQSLAFDDAPWLKGSWPAATAVHILHLASRQVETLPGSQGLWAPKWSPGGQWLAAKAADSKGIRLYDFQRGTWSDLTTTPEIIAYLSWSHDGVWLYFTTSGEDGVPTVYRIRPGDRRPERVADAAGTLLASAAGLWFGLTPDDTPLFMREVDAAQVYRLEVEFP
jgi:WD40 repeat protein